MSVFNPKQSNNIILVGIIILACLLLYALRGLFDAILGSIVLYTIFRPLNIFFVKKKHWRRSWAAILIILISFIAIVIPFTALSIMIFSKMNEMRSANLPINEWLEKVNTFARIQLGQPNFNLANNINISDKLGNFVAELFPSLIGSAADIFVTLLVLYFLLYFMLNQSDEFETGIVKYAPFREQHARKFATELRNATYSNVIGQGIISLSQGILFATGLTIVGFPDPIFWGVIGSLISFLPVIGVPFLSLVFSLILFLNGHTLKGFFLLGYGFFLISYFDSFMRFFINKRLANTHPLITVIGVIIGIPMFGILGLVFGPLLISYFLLMVQIYETNRIAEERLSRIRTNRDNDG